MPKHTMNLNQREPESRDTQPEQNSQKNSKRPRIKVTYALKQKTNTSRLAEELASKEASLSAAQTLIKSYKTLQLHYDHESLSYLSDLDKKALPANDQPHSARSSQSRPEGRNSCSHFQFFEQGSRIINKTDTNSSVLSTPSTRSFKSI